MDNVLNYISKNNLADSAADIAKVEYACRQVEDSSYK